MDSLFASVLPCPSERRFDPPGSRPYTGDCSPLSGPALVGRGLRAVGILREGFPESFPEVWPSRLVSGPVDRSLSGAVGTVVRGGQS